MLLIDGVKYRLWTPKDEEKEFHPMIKEHSKEIFGEDSVYFDIKHKLTSKSGIAAIPDAYVITLSKPYKWYIVENELSSHPVYSHIVPQVSKFISGIDNPRNQREIRENLYNEIDRDKVLRAYVEKAVGSEVYRFLSELLSKPPKIVIIIDEITDDVKEAQNFLKQYDTQVIEFKTYVREGAETVHAHLFEPLHVTPVRRMYIKAPVKKGEVTPEADYALPILEALIEMGGSGRSSEVLDKVFDKMNDRLKPKDLEKIPSGTSIRWKNYARWERKNLILEGYLKKDSPRGIWEITDKGRNLYQSLKQEQ